MPGIGIGVSPAFGCGAPRPWWKAIEATSPVDLWVAECGITIGTGVAAWLSQAGLKSTLAQSTGSKQPTYDTTTNGIPELVFNSAASQCMQTAAICGANAAYTMAAAYKLDALPGAWGCIVHEGNAIGNGSGFWISNTNNRVLYHVGSVNGNAADTNAFAMVVGHDGTGVVLPKGYRNRLATTYPAIAARVPGSGFVRVGASAATPASYPLSMRLRMIAIWDGLISDANLPKVATVMCDHYGIP